MYIAQIKQYDKKRDKVIFDDGLAILLYKGEVRRLRLSEEMTADDILMEKIYGMLEKRARERIVYILKSSDKPENEIRRKLKEGFYPEPVIEKILEWARQHHFVDDMRYAENYIRYHAEGKSKKIVLQTLLQKGIDKDIAETVLSENEELFDEDEQIERELIRRHYSPDMDNKEKQRIIAALARKGYSWDRISSKTHQSD